MNKKIAFSFVVALGISLVFGIFMNFPSRAQSTSRENNERLGLEITTNFNDCKLYIPANLVEGKGLQATIPVKGGDGVTAIRIIPVMENGKVSVSVSYISENQMDTDMAKSERKVATRIASEGETLVIQDEQTTSDWAVKVKAFSATENPNLINLSSGGCECALCGNLQLCPTAGRCLTSSCGRVCCIQTSNPQ